MAEPHTATQGRELHRIITRLANEELGRIQHDAASTPIDALVARLLLRVTGRQEEALSLPLPDATVTEPAAPALSDADAAPAWRDLDVLLERSITDVLGELSVSHGHGNAHAHIRAADGEHALPGKLPVQGGGARLGEGHDVDLDAVIDRILQAIESMNETPQAETGAPAAASALAGAPVGAGPAGARASTANSTPADADSEDLSPLEELVTLVERDLESSLHGGPAPSLSSAVDSAPALAAGAGRAPGSTGGIVTEPAATGGDKPEFRVIDRSQSGFHVADLHLAGAAQERWMRCFRNLTTDERVLGWVAFQDGRLAASDQPHDPAFVESLRGYYESAVALRGQLGTLHDLRFRIEAQEGVLGLTQISDAMWLAIFARNEGDLQHGFALVPDAVGASASAR